MVAQDILSKMRQDRDEPVRSYSARLKGQTRVCRFTARCQCSNCPNHDACVEVDYSDIVVRDQVILGCADHDIKLDCLIEKGTNASLEEVMAFVESKESGKLSLQQLNGGSDAAAPVSSFRKQQRGMFKQQTLPTSLLTPTCTHCGQVGQGSSTCRRVLRQLLSITPNLHEMRQAWPFCCHVQTAVNVRHTPRATALAHVTATGERYS